MRVRESSPSLRVRSTPCPSSWPLLLPLLLLLLQSRTSCASVLSLSELFASPSCTPQLSFRPCSLTSCNGACDLSGTLGLSSTSNATFQSMIISGPSPDLATVQLDAINPVDVPSSLTLQRVHITGAMLVSTPAELDLQGMRLASPSAKISILNSTVKLNCSNWVALQQLICQGGAPGDAQVAGDVITVQHFAAGGTIWHNVMLSKPSQCNSSSASCGATSIPPAGTSPVVGGGGTSSAGLGAYLATRLAAASGTQFLLLTAPAYQLPIAVGADVLQIQADVTIIGVKGPGYLAPELDMSLLSFVLVGSGARLKLQNTIVVNRPTLPNAYPSGLLTCLPNNSGLLALAGGGPSLTFENVTIVVPDDVLHYMAFWFGSGSGTDVSWAISPQGPLDAAPTRCSSSSPSAATASSQSLCLDSMTGGSGAWSFRTVVLAGSAYPLASPRLVNWTGLDLHTLMLPTELSSLASLQLTGITLVTFDISKTRVSTGSNNNSSNLATLLTSQATSGESKQAVAARFRSSHFILVGNNVLDLGFTTRVPMLMSAVVVGDPAAPTSSTLDLGPGGVLNIGGTQSEANCTLYLRNIVLVNTQPARNSITPPSGSNVPKTALTNYSACLWRFGIPRGPPTPALDLRNVTIVLTPIELQVYRSLFNVSTPAPNIYPLALQSLTPMIEANRATVMLQGADVSMKLLSDAAALGTPPSSLPGDMIFSFFTWLGISGGNVTFTAALPASVTTLAGTYSPVDAQQQISINAAASLVLLVPQPAPPPAPLPPPPAPPPTGGVTSSDGGGGSKSNNALIIGLVVGLVVGVLAIGAAIGAFVLHKKWATEKYDPESPPKNSAAFCMGACGGGGGGGMGDGKDSDSSNSSLSPIDGPLSAAGGLASRTCAASTAASNPKLVTTLVDSPSGAIGTKMNSTGSMLMTGSEELNAGAAGTEAAAAAGSGVGGSGRVCSDVSLLLAMSGDGAMSGLSDSQLSSDPTSMKWGLQRQMEAMREELNCGEAQWEVSEQLGKGGFGTVYKGTWRGLQVAIKRVIFQVMADSHGEEKRKAAMQEAAMNETLHHPHIVMTFTSDMQPLGDANAIKRGVLDWQMHIIMEYCDGGSLFDAIKQNRFYDRKMAVPHILHVLELLIQIAHGCAYIHSKNIIHGDLKPDNVLLKTNAASGCQGLGYTAKIADFGLSKSIHGNNTHVSGVKQGTPLYVAPEIMRDGRASKAADVFSFGVIMWELYHGATAYSQYMRVAGAVMRPPSGALIALAGPKAVKATVGGKMLSLQPKLFQYGDGYGIEGGSTSTPPSYAAFGLSCTQQDPTRRPTFEMVLVGLARIRQDLERLLVPEPDWVLEPDPEDC